eukprot:scaffold240947_cov27-Tisochrysis_lutea.AAC.1
MFYSCHGGRAHACTNLTHSVSCRQHLRASSQAQLRWRSLLCGARSTCESALGNPICSEPIFDSVMRPTFSAARADG